MTRPAEQGSGVGDQGSPGPLLTDPERLLDLVAELHEEARRASPGFEVELYHRSALSVRVAWERGSTVDRSIGVEAGTAIRLRERANGATSFAATGGIDPVGIAWALDRCRETIARCPSRDPIWAPKSRRLAVDRDEGAPPTEEQLCGWLEQSIGEVESGGRQAGSAWVEAATVTESWIADPALRASRVRRRGWAVLRPEPLAGGQRPERPVFIARRRWTDLPVDGWRAVLRDRVGALDRSETLPAGNVSVLFGPEAAARLVPALVDALHRLNTDDPLEAGVGWRVRDDPNDPTALFGVDFDDTGWATRKSVLADGARIRGRLSERGHSRRASWADPPTVAPWHLVATPAPSPLPNEAILADAVRIHPITGERWILGLDAVLLDGGRPVASLGSCQIELSPAELVARCVGSVGPCRASHNGVATPALLFVDLRPVR